MRICFVSRELVGFRGGGIGTYVAEAGKALGAAGHEVWLVTEDPGRAQREPLRAHPDFARVLLVGDGVNDDATLRPTNARAVAAYAARVDATLRAASVPFDYVEFADFGAEGQVAIREQRLFRSHSDAVLGVMLHSPTHEIERHNDQLHLVSPARRAAIALEDDAIRAAPALSSPSTRLLEMTRARLGLPNDRGRVVRYPMTLPDELPDGPPARARLADLRFLFFGRIEPRKGVAALVEAFRRMPELSLELVGADGPYSPFRTSYVEWLSRPLPPNVRFAPPLPRPELLRRLADTDVCVLPSVWENWPNACIEAMAAARVVVGGRHGGMSEMIEPGESGFLCDGTDPDDLVRVVRDALGGALRRLPAIGRAAAARIRTLSEPARYVAAIERLVAEHRESRPRPRAATRVTVVVPCDPTGVRRLAPTIASVGAQTGADVELVVARFDGAAIPAPGARVRVLADDHSDEAAARNAGACAANGAIVLFLRAGDLLDEDACERVAEAFAARPEAAAAVPWCRLVDARSGRARATMNPLPFTRALALLPNPFGDAACAFRSALFRDGTLGFDAAVAPWLDHAIWLDCARHGLAVETLARPLCTRPIERRRAAPDRELATLGLLIARHLPPAAGADDERDLLTTLLHGWGLGAAAALLAGSPGLAERPAAMARSIQSLALRHLARMLRDGTGESGAARTTRWLFDRVLTAHGRFKQKRRP